MTSWGVDTGDDSQPSTWGVQGTPGASPQESLRIENLGQDVIEDLKASVMSFREMPTFPSMQGVSETLNNIGTALEERQVDYHPPVDSRNCSMITLDEGKLGAVEEKLLCAANALSSLDPRLLDCAKRYGNVNTKNAYTVGKQIQCLAAALPTITSRLPSIPSSVASLCRQTNGEVAAVSGAAVSGAAGGRLHRRCPSVREPR